MEIPLMQLGPSPTYGTAYYASGSRIIAVEGGSVSDSPPIPNIMKPKTLIDRLLRIDRVHCSLAATASNVLTLSKFFKPTHRSQQRTSNLNNVVTNIDGSVNPIFFQVNQLGLFKRWTASTKEKHIESNSKTTRSPRTHQNKSYQKWVFADHARTGRRSRRKQSHSIRTSRSIDTQRRLKPRSQQSTLFVDC